MNKAARIFTVLLFVLILTLSVCADEARILDYTVTTYFPSATTKFNIPRVTDNNTDTFSTLLSGCGLSLNCDEEIGYVYVKFAGEPVPYTLEFLNTATGEAVKIEKSGDFMHELTEIPVDIREIIASEGYESNTTNTTAVMLIAGEDMPIADIVLYSTGVLPSDVQRWEKPYSECDILCFPTHADDDTLFFGGLISKYVNEGKLVQTAFICDFSKDYQRRHEQLNGLWAMGVKAYPILGIFPDLNSRSLRYAQTQYDSDKMRGFITECIRKTKPSVVVAHDLDGEYGHGAHMLSALLVCESVTRSGDTDFYSDSAEKYGAHDPKKTFLHLYEENPIIIDVFAPVTSDGLNPFELSERGYGQHFSQHKWAFEVTVEDPDADLRKFGLFHSLVGYDTSSGDVLAGVERVIPVISEPLDTSSSEPCFIRTLDTPMHGESNLSITNERPGSQKIAIAVCITMAALLVLVGIFGRRRH